MNHYDILGVSSGAEPEVIKAAYRALSKKYHPNTAKLPLEAAEARMKVVNVAYDVLSDPKQKIAYDKAKSGEDEFDHDDYREFTTAFEEDTREAWELSVEYFPKVEKLYLELAKLSEPLANTFRLTLIVRKEFDKATHLAGKLEAEYLRRLFGDDANVRQFGKRLVLSGERKAAKELNNAVVTFGKSVNSHRLIEFITVKHLRLSNEIKQVVKVPAPPSNSGLGAIWVSLGVFFVFALMLGIADKSSM